jgi:hypothetical protein
LATYRGIDDESFWKKPVNPVKLVLTPEQKKRKEEKRKTTEVEGF